MPQQLTVSVENNFTRGLITDSTGLNFPENASTDTDNCQYTITGDVLRRLGIDFEENSSSDFYDLSNAAISTYKWNNVGGDGETQVIVVQTGSQLNFYNATAATVTSPLSNHKLSSTVDITAYSAGTISDVISEECQFTDGNGYLFVYHPACNPFYCTYNAGAISSAPITVQIRDFVGVVENPSIAVDLRPSTLSTTHQYNLLNQGWTKSTGAKSGYTVGTGSPAVQLGGLAATMNSSGLGFVAGDIVTLATLDNTFPGGKYIPAGTAVMSGTVTGYVGTSININITSIYSDLAGTLLGPYSVVTTGTGYIDTWHTATGGYPSNADVWWYFKNASDAFDPSSTLANVTLSTARAPQGHYIYNAFNQTKSIISTVAGITDVKTNKRPRTGCWFQGRVWYAGVDDSQQAGGTSDYYTWTDKVYFSQVVTTPEDFGKCYQQNDPTSDRLFDILPTDGGVISQPGMGAVYKLFPIANGLLVFAANGVWFITGSQGIGFTANDYTITKLSAVQSISGTSFVDVQGLPFFWNDDGIYQVHPQQGGSLAVDSITVGVINGFYDEIPLSSKRKARGIYHPIEYTIQWIYKDTEATSVSDGYKFNRILNYSTYNKAFFPYSVAITPAAINSIVYVAGPGGSNTPPPAFKYLASSGTAFAFADEHDETYADWDSISPTNYTSYFITGYKLRGQAIKKFQPQYAQFWFRSEDAQAYYIQGIWDYANSPNSGRYSAQQKILTGLSRYNTLYRRHKIRGRGYSLQLKISSVDGMPFDIQGWAIVDTVNQGT